MSNGPMPLQHISWGRPERGIDLIEEDAVAKFGFSCSATVRASESLPRHGRSTWQVKIVKAAGCAAIGVCNERYKKMKMSCCNESNAWVLSTKTFRLDNFTRHLDMRGGDRKERLIHLTFDGDAGTLSFHGDCPDIEPLTNITGDRIYPVVAGYSGADVHVVLSQGSTPKPQAPFLSLEKYIGSLLCDTQDADVVLTVGDERICAHSLVLNRIPYFQRMLSGSFAESRKRKFDDMARGGSQHYSVAVQDSNADTMKQILRFIYTDDAKSALDGLGFAEVISLAQLADMYGLSPLFEAACRALEQLGKDAVVSGRCVLDTLEFAHQHKRLSLRQSMLALLGTRFEEVALTDRFKALPQTDIELYTEIIKEVSRQMKK